MRSRTGRRRRGFTLMEVLLVLAILVILGSLVTVSFIRIQQNANTDAARSQIKLLEDIVGHYMLAIGTPPTTEQGLEALRNAPSDLRNPAKWQGPYLNKDLPKDPWGGDYQYELIDAKLGTYRIWSNGPDGQSGSEDDISSDQVQS
jgi:general secretion pathway protein G